VCFRCRLAEFEAEFDANPLLLHISHFGRSERPQNSTNTTLKKCTEKEHSSTQHNATWQTGSRRVQLAIPRGPQLYYKRFSRGIQISGTFGLHHVLMENRNVTSLKFHRECHLVFLLLVGWRQGKALRVDGFENAAESSIWSVSASGLNLDIGIGNVLFKKQFLSNVSPAYLTSEWTPVMMGPAI
jgi:hypothetical protein